MSKFKIGDKVRLIKDNDDSSCDELFSNDYYVVVPYDSSGPGVKSDDGLMFYAEGGVFKFEHYVPVGPTGAVFADQEGNMKAYGQTTGIRNDVQTKLYLRMILEETAETMRAATPSAKAEINRLFGEVEKLIKVDDETDRVELFDGLLDVVVVAAGAGISAGFPMQAGFDEVMRTNFAKVDPETGKVIRDKDGKVQKPEGWKKPDLAAVLAS